MSKNIETRLMREYAQLIAKYRELFIVCSAQDVLGWDMMTKLPPRGIKIRSDQLAVLGGLAHRMATSPEIGQLLSRIEDNSALAELDPLRRRNVLLMRRTYDEQTAVPEDLVAETARQSAIAFDVWRRSKATNDWKTFRPELQKNVELAKEKAALLMKVKNTESPYDALIDSHEPGMTSGCIATLFDDLWKGLRPLIDVLGSSRTCPETHLLDCRVSISLQQRIAQLIAGAVGYDVSSCNAGGRIDEAEHPFTSGYYGDVRITTHYYENDFANSIFSILHEAGHALYEQGINTEWTYLPVGIACSTGLHESQSRFIENIVGRSRQFWTYLFPRLQGMIGPLLSGVELEQFVRAINKVDKSKIRIEADEVTYSVHGIIRFNIERDLFAGRVKVEELPELWNQSYKEYLGVEVNNYAEGLMQDVHWADGSFGYFPCYVLGNIYDGQFLAKMDQDIPQWTAELEKGNLLPVKQWLTENVYKQGNFYDPADLVRSVTGRQLSVAPFLKYLNDKYASG